MSVNIRESMRETQRKAKAAKERKERRRRGRRGDGTAAVVAAALAQC